MNMICADQQGVVMRLQHELVKALTRGFQVVFFSCLLLDMDRAEWPMIATVEKPIIVVG